jgi:hypothetical protein
MDLIILVMGDPWQPHPTTGATIRRDLKRTVIMTAMMWSLLLGSIKEESLGTPDVAAFARIVRRLVQQEGAP